MSEFDLSDDGSVNILCQSQGAATLYLIYTWTSAGISQQLSSYIYRYPYLVDRIENQVSKSITTLIPTIQCLLLCCGRLNFVNEIWSPTQARPGYVQKVAQLLAS